jgi:hypothetical protein
MEATVANSLGFGQTDLVSGAAFTLGTAPVNFNYQHLAGKIQL